MEMLMNIKLILKNMSSFDKTDNNYRVWDVWWKRRVDVQ